ncbi:MAG: hypothetical protein II916_05655 [Oscillospiraceae bacterium]|nr:hypothetical protein [Oscillospiraceae bacterium]
MLHEKIDLLMNALNVGSSDLARLTQHSPSSFSRLRSGSREPKPDSPTIRRFAEGVTMYAKQTHQTDKLCLLVHTKSEKTLILSVIKWLYSDQMPLYYTQPTDPAGQFSERLDQLMRLAGMNNHTLSEASEMEYSYISRLHRGERFPKSGSESVRRICDALFTRIIADGKRAELSKLTGLDEEPMTASILRDWLCGLTDKIDLVTIRRLIGSISNVTENAMPAALPDLPEVCIQDSYHGNAGLQEAVVRFLTEIPENGEMLLYSDHPMSWMTGEFQPQWAALMLRCLRRGVRIRIIHNIDRDITEMLDAITSWMPLYLTGAIMPFYSLKPRGEQFCHTLFLCPETAAISGFSPCESECSFSYVTDKTRLQQMESEFAVLLGGCKPLLTVSRKPQNVEGTPISRNFDNAEVIADHRSVVVNKLTAPLLSFRFYHPQIVESFRTLLG